MRGERGRHFDPRLVDLFLENVDEVTELRERYTPGCGGTRADSGLAGHHGYAGY